MSECDTAAPARQTGSLLIRGAESTDYGAIRDVVIAAYAQYAGLLGPDLFARYLDDLLDLQTHASYGRLLVAETEEGIRGFAAFYPDASVQGFGLPSGWAGGRALAVHPAGRGHGVARALLATAERLALEAGAPVFAFHTASFMTSALSLYERLGYRRAPEYDFDMAARYGVTGAAPVRSVAFLRYLAPGVPEHREDPVTARVRKRRPSSTPAYYLARPAGLWLAALAPQPAKRATARACAGPSDTGPSDTGPSDTGHSAGAKG
jgi:GNAT superfamily N-acetyltransferase